jgi:Ca2+-transporting ATPase
MGRIGVSLNRLETETPRLQHDMRRLVLSLGLFGGLASLSAVLLYGLLRGNWLDAILAGIALGMSMLPEEFPVVLTVFMAMGAWRISRARVLTRRAAAIETLGSATVLCTDKTGTLTENRMQVAALWSAASGATRVEPGAVLPPPLALMLDTAALASAPDPFDPMERAFHAARPNPHPNDMALLVSYPLRPDLLVMTQIWDRNGSAYAAAKGAPEAVLHLCRLPDDERHRIGAAVDSLAAEGLRVLALAAADLGSAPLPETQNDLPLQFLGLIGLADPLRAGIPEAVRQCRSAGIRIIMVTGDYPVTARAIARAAGIDHEAVLSGDEVATLDDAALADRLKTVSIFARVMPEQKLRLVETLKRQGEIVAMTGDGVNDAPSLKAAHIGIAMGGRGTDVAREASALVLLDDDFASIVAAIRLGRRIYDNLRKAAGFILAVHVPIAALALLPLALGLPVILWPIHIAFLEMVIDPVCSLVFESEGEEKDIMTRPPRPARGSLFSRQLVVASLIRGGLAFAVVFAVLSYAALNALPETSARGLAFTTLLLAILALIVGNRTFSSGFLAGLRGGNPLLVFVPIGMLALIGVSQFWPPARDLFRFGPLSGVEIALALCAAAALMVGISLERRIERRLTRR